MRQAYTVMSDRYIELFASGEHEHPDDLRLIGKHLGRLRGPVVDLGCGPGHLTAFLRSTCPDVVGIDLVPEFIAHARDAHPSAQFEVGSLLDPTRRSASVEGILAWYSLIHFRPDQLDHALVAVRRVLKPGGVLVAGFFLGDLPEPFEHKVITAYRWPVGEMERRLEAAGFAVIDRITRGQNGDRRPHAALAASAI